MRMLEQLAKCVNEGSVVNSPVHRSYSGGVVAYNLGSVTDCKNLGNVSTEVDYAGGLVGKDSSDTEVVNSFSAGDSALAGVIHKIEGKISNCYYDSSVLVGLSSVSRMSECLRQICKRINLLGFSTQQTVWRQIARHGVATALAILFLLIAPTSQFTKLFLKIAVR